jgi:hypothetical protein
MSSRPSEGQTGASGKPEPDVSRGDREFAALTSARDEYTDDRKPFEWQSRYTPEARRGINFEAWVLSVSLLLVLLLTGIFLGLSGQLVDAPIAGLGMVFHFDFRILAIFFAGWVGGATFSIKPGFLG